MNRHKTNHNVSRSVDDHRIKTVFLVESMHCASCVNSIESALEVIKGVEKVNVNLAVEKAIITYKPDEIGVDQLIDTVTLVRQKAPPFRGEMNGNFFYKTAHSA